MTKLELIKEIIKDYINPGLVMHSGSVEIASYEEEEQPTLNLIFHGMCGSCPSSFDQTLITVSNFIKEEAEIENLIVKNVSEKPNEFNMKYVFNPEED